MRRSGEISQEILGKKQLGWSYNGKGLLGKRKKDQLTGDKPLTDGVAAMENPTDCRWCHLGSEELPSKSIRKGGGEERLYQASSRQVSDEVRKRIRGSGPKLEVERKKNPARPEEKESEFVKDATLRESLSLRRLTLFYVPVGESWPLINGRKQNRTNQKKSP